MKDRITGHTVLTGLLGSPVAHSISPMMHNESFRQLGLDYAYLAFDVGTDNLKTAVEGLKVLGVRGFNLTMPDKNLMCTYCDKLSPAAELIGAVNTVVNDNGVLTGHTTDGIGYMEAARDAGYDLTGKTMTLLGGGGAFRDAWTSFTDHLRFTDFFFRGGLLSLSISFIPKLLFNVVKAGFNAVEGVHTFFFGGPSKAAEDLQTYKNDMSALRADAKSQRG